MKKPTGIFLLDMGNHTKTTAAADACVIVSKEFGTLVIITLSKTDLRTPMQVVFEE